MAGKKQEAKQAGEYGQEEAGTKAHTCHKLVSGQSLKKPILNHSYSTPPNNPNPTLARQLAALVLLTAQIERGRDDVPASRGGTITN